MPIRDELPVYKSNPVPRANNNNAGNDGGGVGGGSNPPIAELDQLNLDPGQPSEGGATGGGGEPSKDGATEDASGEEEEDDEDAIQEGVPENRKMLKLRKGFRLSSMCWDND